MLGSRHDEAADKMLGGHDKKLGGRQAPSDAPSPATTCTTSPHASPHKPPMDKPEEGACAGAGAGAHGPPCSASGTSKASETSKIHLASGTSKVDLHSRAAKSTCTGRHKVDLHSRAAPAYRSPEHRPQVRSPEHRPQVSPELAAKGSSWSSCQLQQLRVPRSPHSTHLPSSPHSAHTLPKSASRWRRWLRWGGGAADGGEGRGEEAAQVGGDHSAHQTHEAHQGDEALGDEALGDEALGDEALLWHTQYLDFLSDFMLVEEGRCVGGAVRGCGRAVCRALLVSRSLARSFAGKASTLEHICIFLRGLVGGMACSWHGVLVACSCLPCSWRARGVLVPWRALLDGVLVLPCALPSST